MKKQAEKPQSFQLKRETVRSMVLRTGVQAGQDPCSHCTQRITSMPPRPTM